MDCNHFDQLSMRANEMNAKDWYEYHLWMLKRLELKYSFLPVGAPWLAHLSAHHLVPHRSSKGRNSTIGTR